jgi:outer membrane receptor protein involved in Fe transport
LPLASLPPEAFVASMGSSRPSIRLPDLPGARPPSGGRCSRGAVAAFVAAAAAFGPHGSRAQDPTPAAASEAPAPAGEPPDALPAAASDAPAPASEAPDVLPAAPAAPDGAPGEIVVHGRSDAAAARDSAAPVTVVDTTRARTQTADLGEVLARTEGVGVRRSGGLGSSTRLSLNGFTGDQVRLFIDGVPLDASGFGLGTGSIPLDFLDRVDIYQGVVPIAFGADALGGAVNLVTRRDLQGTGGSASLETGAFGTLRVTAGGHHVFSGAGLYVRAFAAVDRADNDYPVDVQVADPTGRTHDATVHRFHDGYAAEAGGVEAGVLGQPWAEQWMVRVFASHDAKELQSNLTMAIPYGDVTSDNTSYGVLMRYENRLWDGRVAVRSSTGYGLQSDDFEDLGEWIYDWFGQRVAPRSGPGEITAQGSDRTLWQKKAYERLDVDATLAPGHRIEVALAPTWSSREGKERRTPHDTFDTLTVERSMTTVDSGLAYHLALFDRLENTAFFKVYYYTAHTLDTTGAGSFTHGMLTGNAYVERTFDHSSAGYGDMARLGLLDGLHLKASYEHATRLPRPDELFGDNVFIVPNDDLRPETSDNYNLGLQYESGATAAGRFGAEVTGFLRVAEGLIAVLGSTDYELRYQNLVDATSKGVQGSAKWTSPHRLLAVDGNATWMDFRNRSKSGYFGAFYDVRMPNTPYLFANGGARLSLHGAFAEPDELSLDWHVRYVHEFFRAWENVGIESTKQTIPRQTTQSLALAYAIGNAERRFVGTIECDNLTDEKTFDFFGQQRPGRAVYWKGSIEFY